MLVFSRIFLPLLAALFIHGAAASPFPKASDEPERDARGEKWDLTAQARFRTTGQTDFILDRLGTTSGQGLWHETRLRLGGRLQISEAVSITAQMDALSGLAAGDTTPVGTARGDDTLAYPLDRRFGGGAILPRMLYATIRLPVGQMQIGQQSFSWGLGMLANDGQGEPDFGDHRGGSLVHRALFATQPFAPRGSGGDTPRNLTVFLALDHVFQDPNADFLLGDRAYQTVLGVRGGDARMQFGAYQGLRLQEDRSDPAMPERATGILAATTNAFGSLPILTVGEAGEVRVEGEGALILGKTDRPYLEETHEAGAAIRALGGILRLRYDDEARRTSVSLETGLASGDNDPRDATVRDFSFHPNYKVGLLLFDQYLARLSARSIDRVVSPELLAEPPPSTRFLATQGAVTGTVYFNPVARWRPTEVLELRAGYLFAMSAGDLVDAYETANNGGYNASYGGGTGSNILGHEVNLAARVRLPLPAQVVLRFGADGGVLFPGKAFSGLGGSRPDPVYGGRLLADLAY